MKTFFCQSLFVGLLLSLIQSLQAQVPEQWGWSLQLLGNWKGPATITLGDQSFNVTYSAHFKTAVAGSGMTMDENFSDPNLGNFKGNNVIGLNAFDGLIHWSTVDNFGTAHEHIGSWSDNKNFHMEHHISGGGQTFDEIIDLALNANITKVTISLTAIQNGETIETIEGTLTRSNGNNAGEILNSVNRDTDSNPGTSLDIYPNPSSGMMEIRSGKPMEEISITDGTGRIIYLGHPLATNHKLVLERPGTYIVSVRMGEEVITRQVNVF